MKYFDEVFSITAHIAAIAMCMYFIATFVYEVGHALVR